MQGNNGGVSRRIPTHRTFVCMHAYVHMHARTLGLHEKNMSTNTYTHTLYSIVFCVLDYNFCRKLFVVCVHSGSECTNSAQGGCEKINAREIVKILHNGNRVLKK